jgi:hypothetical protein
VGTATTPYDRYRDHHRDERRYWRD